MAFSPDLEKGPLTTVSTVSSPILTDTTLSSPDPNSSVATKRLSQFEQFQVLVGNVDAPPSPTEADRDFYHELVARERSATRIFWISGILFFIAIAAQIILCLGITAGAPSWDTSTIQALAGVNTGVAATIAVLKGLGLPDKKGVERTKLQRLIERIKLTTKRYQIGIDTDANAEVTDLRKIYEEAEDAAEISVTNVSAGLQGAFATGKAEYKKVESYR